MANDSLCSKKEILVATLMFCCMFRQEQNRRLVLKPSVCRFRCNVALDVPTTNKMIEDESELDAGRTRCVDNLDAMLQQMEVRQLQLQGQVDTMGQQLAAKEACIQKLQIESNATNKLPAELHTHFGGMVKRLMHVEGRLGKIKAPS